MPRSRNKRKKAVNRFSIVLWTAIITIIVIQLNQTKKTPPAEHPPQIVKPVAKAISPAVTRIQDKLARVKTLEKQEKYSAAVALFNEITSEVSNSETLDNAFKFYIWELKAHLHTRLWQHADAMLALNQAMLLATQQQRTRLQQFSDWLENVVEQNNKERNQKTDYIASPHVGPSATLTGEVGVIHLYIEENSGSSWGLKQRTLSLTAMDKAKIWLAREVAKYGKTVNFHHRVFLIDRNPAIKRLAIGGKKMRHQNANPIVKLAVKQLGARSVMDFLSKQKQELHVEQIMLLVHVNKKDRSFAKRCLFKCASTGEYTYIFEEAVIKNWQSLEYTQAHESLHLFGADDLYNIQRSTYYASRDIMNYPSKFIDASVIEPITAFAVGLIDKKPEAPFKIKIVKY